MTNNRDHYDIGYAKPPVATRFKKGSSGNHWGRPKMSINFASTIDQELRQQMDVVENGECKTLSKKRALAKQMVNKAIGGRTHEMTLLVRELLRREERVLQKDVTGQGCPTCSVVAAMTPQERHNRIRELLAKAQSRANQNADSPENLG